MRRGGGKMDAFVLVDEVGLCLGPYGGPRGGGGGSCEREGERVCVSLYAWMREG